MIFFFRCGFIRNRLNIFIRNSVREFRIRGIDDRNRLRRSAFRFARRGLRIGVAFFILAKVVPDSDADSLQRLFANSWNLLQLFGGHICKRFHGRNARRNQLLNNRVAQL